MGRELRGSCVRLRDMMPSRELTARAATRVQRDAKATALEQLREFLETEGMKSKTGPRSFADFERALHERMMEAERDIVATGDGATGRRCRRGSSLKARFIDACFVSRRRT